MMIKWIGCHLAILNVLRRLHVLLRRVFVQRASSFFGMSFVIRVLGFLSCQSFLIVARKVQNRVVLF